MHDLAGTVYARDFKIGNRAWCEICPSSLICTETRTQDRKELACTVVLHTGSFQHTLRIRKCSDNDRRDRYKDESYWNEGSCTGKLLQRLRAGCVEKRFTWIHQPIVLCRTRVHWRKRTRKLVNAHCEEEIGVMTSASRQDKDLAERATTERAWG